MKRRVITLCYRKIIDANTKSPWETMVFDDSFLEFKMQFQNYNKQNMYTSYAELVQDQPIADKLNFLVTASVTGYIQQLNERVPDLLNNLGRHFLTFKNYSFEIINSEMDNQLKHQVAISFYSESLIWHDTIDSYLLVSKVEDQEQFSTDLFKLQPFVGIHSLKYI